MQQLGPEKDWQTLLMVARNWQESDVWSLGDGPDMSRPNTANPKNRQCYIVISPHPAGRKLFPSCFPAKKWNLNLNHGAMRIHCMGIASKKLVRTICPATPPALAIGVQSSAFWLLCSSYLRTSAHQSTSTSSTWDFRGPRANCKHPNQRDVTKGKVITNQQICTQDRCASTGSLKHNHS